MAEEGGDVAAEAKSLFSKKLGPLPVAVWVGAALLIYLYMKRRSGTGAAGQQTDPAGNVGTIDPATGYVYGTAGDTSGLAGSSGGSSFGGSSGSSGSGSTVAGQYADNNAWARAAINFLVGVGVDPTAANSAVTQYITSQALTIPQQAEVNLAIQSIGAPPVPPTPGTSPPPVVTPPDPGTVYASNPVTGLSVTDKTSTTISVVWNKVANATAYTVNYSGGQGAQSMTVSGTASTAVLTGLSPGTSYSINVQATPAKSGDPSASTSATTSAASSAAPSTPAPKMPDQSPTTIQGHTYRAVAGDTWTSIAKKVGLSEAALWAYNINPAHNTSAQIATLKQRGQGAVTPGETIRVP